MTGERSPDLLARLRAAILADGAATERLAAIGRDDAFLAAAGIFAAGQGLALAEGVIAGAMRPDPLGLDRMSGVAAVADGWPAGRWWLPTGLARGGGELVVDWAHFGDVAIDAPFFEESLRRARSRPFNRLMRHRTRLAGFVRQDVGPMAAPAGLIFHMSRCGSTLVASMLGTIGGALAISEPPPLDDIVQLVQSSPDVPLEDRAALLRAMAAALGRAAGEDPAAGGRYFLKLDSWHALALPLFRAAFPSTPWIFLYRDPVEVLVSHMRVRGLQTVPGALPPAIFGIAGGERMAAEVYCARVLAQICQAALDHGPLGGGLFIDYADLPHAVENAILPHFGVVPDVRDRAALAAASWRDAKSPHRDFAADSAAKQGAATAAVREAAATFLAEPCRRLEQALWSAR